MPSETPNQEIIPKQELSVTKTDKQKLKPTIDLIDPETQVNFAARCAKALAKVFDQKKKKVVINGEHYLEYEDWQTLAQFYNMTVKTKGAEPIRVGGIQGAKAFAEVIDTKTGNVIGGAEAYCLRDEKKWQNKPFHQLASMAQTRAGAKALRNILSRVAVLAGYNPTPVEEIADHAADPNMKPATKKQVGFILKLIKERDVDKEYFTESFSDRFSNMTSQKATEAISYLLTCPPKEKTDRVSKDSELSPGVKKIKEALEKAKEEQTTLTNDQGETADPDEPEPINVDDIPF